MEAEEGEEFRTKLENICKLRRDGQGRADEALKMIPVAAFYAVTHRPHAGGTPREKWQREWALHAGMSWKQLSEFPDRIRRMAEELERVSRHSSFDLKRITSEIPLAMYAKREYRRLPATLRNYADLLQAQIKSDTALLKSFYRRVPRKYSPFIPYLSEQVKLLTGGPYDSQVADLLNAADYALNASTEIRFYSQHLVDLRTRHKRKTRRA